VHGRTRKEMSLVPAKWDRIKRAVEIRNELKSKILIIGNGDVLNLEDAKKKAKESGVDGVMLGRAIFGNPWLFNKKIKKVSDKKRLEVLVEHTKLFEKIFKRTKNFAIMKKHFKAYCSGFQGAKELRIKLMEAKNAKEVESLVKIWLKGNRIS
jgi:tRNA-dihydrouridine synthase